LLILGSRQLRTDGFAIDDAPHGTIETDDRPVEHWVLHDAQEQMCNWASVNLAALINPSVHSSERPIRGGKTALFRSEALTRGGIRLPSPVAKGPGATVITRMPYRAISRASGRVRLATPPLEAA
jgi:hypothetical protein